MTELKPCPFCGGEAEYKETAIPDGNCSYPVGYVECNDCGAKTGLYNIKEYYGITPYTEKEICRKWNRRAEDGN